MFSFFKKPSEEISIIFDIGSGSVGAALVKFPADPRGSPTILYSYREPLKFIPRPSSKRLLSVMLRLLSNVAKHVQRDGLSHVHLSYFTPTLQRVICVFSSPWYASQTKVLKIEKEKPFKITQSFLDDIIKREDEQFKILLLEGGYEETFGPDVKVLEKKIIGTRLNGYEVKDPIDKEARELEVTFLSSFISSNILTSVEKVLHEVFHFRRVRFYSYALASWNAVQHIFPSEEEFLFFDIGEEVTDITLTTKNVLVETVSVPLGRSLFLRQVAKDLDVSAEISLSYLKMYTTRTADKKFADEIAAAVEKAQTKYFDKLFEALLGLGKRYSLPPHAFVTTDLDLANLFLDILKRKLPAELNVPEGHFTVFLLGSETFKSHVEFAPYIAHDPFLALESIFIRNVIQ